MMQNAQPPLRSNDLFDIAEDESSVFRLPTGGSYLKGEHLPHT